MRLRWYDYTLAMFLALNGFILAQRLVYLATGRENSEGDYLLLRSLVEFAFSAVIITYFVTRHKIRSK